MKAHVPTLVFAFLVIVFAITSLVRSDDTAPLILPIPAPTDIQQPTRAVPQEQCVRINVQDKGRNGAMSHGTATYLGAGLVVTVQHNVRDTASNQVQIVFPQDQTFMGTIIFEDKKQDICIVLLPALPKCEGATIALELPEVGDPLAVQGYAKGDYAQSWGVMSHRKYGAPGVTWYSLTGTRSRQGDSGGPIFDAEGRFVGTLWGSCGDYGGETQFTSAKWIVDKILELGRELDSPDPDVYPNPNNPLYAPDGMPLKYAGRYHYRSRTRNFFKRARRRTSAVETSEELMLAGRYHLRTRTSNFYKRVA